MKQQKKKVVISVKPEKKKQEKTMVYPMYSTKQEINTIIQGWDRGGLNE
jgi:hypothetical protein